MEPVKEQLIEAAIQDVEQGSTQAAAAARYSISRSTLNYRIHGKQARSEAFKHKQRLSPEQERFLADWCLNEEGAGRAPSRRQVVGFAQSILREGGDGEALGERWLDRFLRRNPAVKMKNSSPLELLRTKGSTREEYNKFYTLLEAQIAEKKVVPANIANIDEHGMQELESKGGKVIGTELSRKAYVTSSDATTWVSVIECGTAEGRRLHPCIVFTGASLQGQWFPEDFEMQRDFPDWKYDKSLTGWSNAQIFLKWFREVYLIETKPQRPSDWRILILDEHSSHLNDDFMFLAFKHKVQLIYLPPHTSHKTQPLDRSVFGPLKNYFRQHTKALAGYTAAAAINKRRFLYCYRDASREGMTSGNLRSGFRKTGIWPFNPSIVMDDPEAVLDNEALPARPPTPPQLPTAGEQDLFSTPQKSSDLRTMQLVVREQLSPTNRHIRTLFHKAGKSLDLKNAEIAALRQQVLHLQTELEVHKPHTRTRVKESGNERFARISDIATAQKASERAPKRRKTGARAEEHIVEEAEEMIVHGLDKIRRVEEE